jgi:nitrogen regulatory protein PII-like uncharacterized protein
MMKMNEYLDRALKGQKAVSEEDNKNVDIMTNLLKNMTPEQKKAFLAKTGLKEEIIIEAEEEDYSHMPPDNMKNLKLYVKWDNSDPQTFTMLKNLVAKIRANKTISAKEAGVAGEFINKILGINPSKFKMFLGSTPAGSVWDLSRSLKETTVTEAAAEEIKLTSQDEKMIASKMKAKGYKFVLVFPKEYNLEPLYVKDMAQGRGLMRDEFKRMKGMTITSVSKWLGEKDTEE